MQAIPWYSRASPHSAVFIFNFTLRFNFFLKLQSFPALLSSCISRLHPSLWGSTAAMATTPTSNNADESNEQDVLDAEEQKFLEEMGWKALFSFTTRKHLPVLAFAVLASTLAALTLPALAVVYGLLFREFGSVAKGDKSDSLFLKQISTYCIYVTAIGGVSWLGNSLHFATFMTFGELQARGARGRIFDTLLKKDIAWYDTRDTGVAAFLPAMQT